jgi:hypothetical protein
LNAAPCLRALDDPHPNHSPFRERKRWGSTFVSRTSIKFATQQLECRRGANGSLPNAELLDRLGAFKRDGAHTAPNNAAFDESLRAQNPEWGLRDIGDLDSLAQDAGLSPAALTAMPANNWVLAFTRPLRQN